MFSLGDPEAVFVFDGNLAGDVLAAEGFVGGEPGGGVTVGFLLVGGAVDGEEIERVGGELVALIFGEALGALLPGVREGDDVVDLDAFGELGFFGEFEGLAGVGFDERAFEDRAVVASEDGGVADFAFDDDLAEAAAGDFRPVGVEFVAGVAGFRGATFDGELFEDVEGEGCVRIGRVRGDDGVRAVRR